MAQTGTSAEFFVMGELLRRGHPAWLSIGTHKQIDILLDAGGKIVIIDVKSVHGRKPHPNRKSQVSWNMPKVEERGSISNLFYVLVWMGNLSPGGGCSLTLKSERL